ncbi:MAG: cytochrome C [Bacteroidia bacterium]|nr:cytochrome C [Bacteroidia bacterium]
MNRTKGLIAGFCVLVVSACSSNQKENTGNDQASSKSTTETVIPDDVQSALARNTCLSCHKADRKLIGPSYKEAASKLNSVEEIIELIHNPQPERWPGYPPMVGVPVSDKDGETIARWILSLKKTEN